MVWLLWVGHGTMTVLCVPNAAVPSSKAIPRATTNLTALCALKMNFKMRNARRAMCTLMAPAFVHANKVGIQIISFVSIALLLYKKASLN